MTQLKHWILKVSVACFVLFVGGLGGWVGSKIATKRYALSMIERVLLTPIVRPGEPIVLAQHVDRHDQCEILVKRVIKTSDGQRFSVKQEFDEGFGPVGGDKYKLPVPTSFAAPYGDAEMFSKAYSWCTWLDYIWPSEGEPWTMHFRFGPNTVTDKPPASFERIGVKHSRTPTQ